MHRRIKGFDGGNFTDGNRKYLEYLADHHCSIVFKKGGVFPPDVRERDIAKFLAVLAQRCEPVLTKKVEIEVIQ